MTTPVWTRFCVSRVANRTPVSIDRVRATNLKRSDGYCYFVATLRKTPQFTQLGLGLKAFRGKFTIHTIEKNSIASNAYMVGDSILDVNSERAPDAETLKKRLNECLASRGFCSTIVERPESAGALQNIQATMSLLASTSSEPQMSEDVIAIGQREMMRYRANVNKERHVKPILKSSTCSSKTASASASETEKKDNELSVVRSIYLTGVHFERKKKKGVTFQHRNVETTIDTDVQNPNLLQKLKKPGQIRALGLTMLPVIFFKSTHAAPPPPPKK